MKIVLNDKEKQMVACGKVHIQKSKEKGQKIVDFVKFTVVGFNYLYLKK